MIFFVMVLMIVCCYSEEYKSILEDPLMRNSRSFFLRHSTGNKTLYGPIGDLSKPHDWSISQWQIPEELKAEDMSTDNCQCGQYDDGISLFSTYNEYARVCLCNDKKLSEGFFELRQDGESLKCGTFSEVEEFDLFVEQSESMLGKSPILSQVKSFLFEFTIQMNEMNIISYECGDPCSGENNNVTYSSSLASLILTTSGHSSNPQTLFLQFILYDSRSKLCKSVLDPCSTKSTPTWFFTKNPTYGVNFGVGSLGKKKNNNVCISNLHQKYEYELEVVDIIKEIFEMNSNKPEGLDTDLSHWRISSFYVGNLMQGKIQCDISVTSVNLSYV